jgi:hypothetical protein
MKFHTWGAEFGTRSVVWWDMWAHSFCWQVVQTPGPGDITVTFTRDEAVALRETADFALGMVGPEELAADLAAALVKLDARIPDQRENARHGDTG